MAEVMEVLGEAAGKTLNALQRNVAEDNLTAVRTGGAASDGAIIQNIGLDNIKSVVNTLDRNDARTFAPLSTGSQNVGTLPIQEAYWGICHPDVAVDLVGLSGFIDVQQYAGQVDTVPGEFGTLPVAGTGVRFIRTSTSTIDAGAGAAVTSQDVNATSAQADVYNTVIYGRDALGSVGLGRAHSDGIFRAGDRMNFEIISKPFGSGGTSDPLDEIMTVGYKAWHAGAVLDSRWGRVIKSTATNLSN
jgi:N4-gp56 family major capsid protein